MAPALSERTADLISGHGEPRDLPISHRLRRSPSAGASITPRAWERPTRRSATPDFREVALKRQNTMDYHDSKALRERDPRKLTELHGRSLMMNLRLHGALGPGLLESVYEV